MDVGTAATQTSKLLPLLFEGLAEDQAITVLDLGSGVGETISFFSGYRCRLHFIDLFSESVVHKLQDDVGEAELVEQFSRAFSFPEGSRFNICLFWDFLNYLDGPALRAFVQALAPYVDASTLSHGFGMLNAKTVLNNNAYGIRRHDLLSYRRRREPQLPVYPHSQRELYQLLGQFQVKQSRLMVDGQLEFILRYHSADSAQEPRRSVFNF